MYESNNSTFLLFNIGLGVFITAMLWLGGMIITPGVLGFSIITCMTLTKAGEMACKVGRLDAIKSKLFAEFVVGFVVISLPMTVLSLLFKISALASLSISAFIVLILAFAAPKKDSLRALSDRHDLAVALVLAISIGLLARIPISSAKILLTNGFLPIWSDYFIHGITIASFGSPFAAGFDMELAGVNRIFYHYAPFMIPAAFQMVSGASGLAIATSLLLPLGLLIAAFGSYVLAVELGTRCSGLLTVASIICLPAYLFFIQSGWFDFHWLLLIAPGSGYALGVSALVCASLYIYCNKPDFRVLAVTVLLLASLIVIRVHMFMLLAPAVFAILLIRHCRRSLYPILFSLGGAIFVGILLLHFSAYFHAFWTRLGDPRDYFNMTIEWSRFYGLPIKEADYLVVKILIQLLIALISILGIYFILYPSFLVLRVKKFGFNTIDMLPLFLLLNFLLLMLFAPIAGNGDITEYKHRHFLLLYLIVAIFTITYGLHFWRIYTSNKFWLKKIIYLLSIFIFVATIFLNWKINPARPYTKAMPWAEELHGQKIEPGLAEAAGYLKTHANRRDVFAMGVQSLGTVLNAPAIEIISLSGVSSFIARPELKVKDSECVREVVSTRLTVLQNIAAAENWADAKKILVDNGIRWFLVYVGDKPRWDQAHGEAIFSSGDFSVYDSGVFNSWLFGNPKC